MKNLRRCMLMLLVLLMLPMASQAQDANLALKGFYESAFQGEFGDTKRGATVRWEDPIVIHPTGSYTESDLYALVKLIFDLSKNVPELPHMIISNKRDGANVVMSFVKEKDMAKAVKGYRKGNIGFVWVEYNDFVIERAEIAIDIETMQEKRAAVVREEIVNMLGLLNDITVTRESIICQRGKTVSDLTVIDYAMLNYLYSPLLPAGTTMDDAIRILEN